MLEQKKDSLGKQITQMCNMCMALGIHKNVYQGQQKMLSHMPISYYPYQLSQATFLKLNKAHLIWVNLLLKVSKDKNFVNKVFQKTAKSDQFVKRYLDLYNKYIDNQTYGVSSFRVDYMGDEEPQLVQFNLMSVGLNGISDLVQRLASLKKKQRVKNKQYYYPNSTNQISLVNAIQLTLKQQKIQGMVLMIVHQKHQKQFNFGDQNAFELETLKRGIQVKRCSMTQFISNYSINQNNNLYYSQQKVSTVYFRTAYSPHHYPTQQHWRIRQQIQKSNALSIPSVSMQLINFKRMQVQLSKIQILKNYLTQQEAILISSLCGQIYHFEDLNQLDKLRKLAQSHQYILKSNRQGGGNNYFGQQASRKIQQLYNLPGQLEKYILMNKIKSDIRDNIFIAHYKYIVTEQSTCELSTMGSFAYNRDQLVYNQCSGNLVRIKKASQNQGGIAVDKAVIAGLCIIKD